MTAAEQILKMQNMLHENTGLIIALGVIVVLVITIICLLVGRGQNKNSNRQEVKDKKRENKRREREAYRIKREIEAEFKSQSESLEQLKQSLRNRYKDVSKTYLNISRNSHQDLFYTLQQLFNLEPNDQLLYCRRYEKIFGSDSFFIIMEDKIGYAPRRKPLDFIYFSDIDNFNGNSPIQIMDKGGDVSYVDYEDFTYDNSGLELARYLNKYVRKYKTKLEIYVDACFDALASKATPILPELISKLENYHPQWACFIRASYKYILCEDGISVQDNWREASYDIESLLSDPEVKEFDNVYNGTLLLKAKFKLLNNEDHIEIKKIIDTVLGNDKCPRFIIEEAQEVRRKLIL